ncbi:MAG TPA: hypothetical protein DEO84_10840 [candidate division Zixibacteria bacterium]|nr:hypothetical protein [candidate division Zixibacteria bacterium]HBZ01804.1 hypothetical protein [candidate division Zixibacteria bacterium]
MFYQLCLINPIQAGVFSWLGGLLTDKTLAALGAILMIYIGILVKKYLLPLLAVQHNREVAEYILVIADDVTDYFRLKFPSAHWSVWLDRAVDRIIEITGVGRETADRVARAAVARKNDAVSQSKANQIAAPTNP